MGLLVKVQGEVILLLGNLQIHLLYVARVAGGNMENVNAHDYQLLFWEN